jgi:hypothetical protein
VALQQPEWTMMDDKRKQPRTPRDKLNCFDWICCVECSKIWQSNTG